MVALVLLQARVEVTGDPVVGGRLAMDRAGHGVVVVVSQFEDQDERVACEHGVRPEIF